MRTSQRLGQRGTVETACLIPRRIYFLHAQRHGVWQVQPSPVVMCPVPTASALARKAGIVTHAISPPAAQPSSNSEAVSGVRGANWQVHKFGGTCMASADRIRAAAELMVASVGPDTSTCVVVSAMGNHPTSPIKVTDLILNMIKKASRQDAAFLVDLAALQEKHVETAKQLLGQSKELTQFVASLMDDITNLKAMLQAMSIAGMSTDAFSDFVVGHGELWSGRLFALCCRQLGADVAFMDTRDVLVVTPTSDGGSVDLDEQLSNGRMDDWFKANGPCKLVVATGFIARSREGTATTLKRNGSDFSATIMGALLRSRHITIWTDVDGVYSADPRKVPEAVCLPSMTYHEAWELSYFGANVLHPRTTLPAMKYHIPITIRNFFNQTASGTRISDFAMDMEVYQGKATIKGFATIDNVTLINVEGTGMVGVPGIASRIFSSVRDAGINVIMISQASSEQSICFAVKGSDGEAAARVLTDRFAESITAGRVSAIQVIPDCCVLAAVGQGMVARKGVAATMMGALAKANVNIKAIAQGSSEYNITVLIDQVDSERALRAVHSRFYLSDVPIGVGIVGPGLIGGTLIQQLREQRQLLKKEFGIDLRLLAVASSSKMLLRETGVDLDNWRQELDEKCDLDKFGNFLSTHYIPNRVIVDCTASDAPASKYINWMKQGIHVVTPNKKLGSGPLEQYQSVRRMQREGYIHFFYEGTVGAGLPVMGTLKHLLETGDKIIKIEGILSGTLSYIFNTFGDGRPFSEVVQDARVKGYTEPDPRDDLNGTDVARKVCILARECGLFLEMDQIPVESLVPEPLREVASSAEYMSRLPSFDGDMDAKLREAEDSGECLRYVGVVDAQTGRGSVELRRYPKSHPFAQLQGSDNIISFTTARYFKQPLIIRGPGAGADVTAAGVFSDLLRLAAYLGAPS
ncbi:hypothetical protein Vretimale_15367 [Volvox reticuliferus]|uniref:ACT domain-containing protein n=1 Tax=Volvox reticuliferus TaxID=1737510 RepID=A0A8J4LW43_9CHLO|nr:hypothetical protein Vretifemale_16477 [Volvox reticuliferus]GIM11911.1 hypothetical protein Vretimale_15367 [Volvox reticuliferus]